MGRHRLGGWVAATTTLAVVASLLITAPAGAEPGGAAPADDIATLVPFAAPVGGDGSFAGSRYYKAEKREATAEEARRQAIRLGHYSYNSVGTGGRSGLLASGPRKPPAEPNEGEVQECMDGDGAGSVEGRVHNRFLWCQRNRIGGEVRNKRGRVIGHASFVMRSVAYGRDDGDRSVKVFMRAEKDSDHYEGPPWETPGLRSTLLHIWADCDNFLDGCSAGGATAGDTIRGWAANPRWYSWTVRSNETGEQGSSGPDLVDRHLWHLKIRVFNHEKPDVGPMQLKSHIIRCDSAAVGFARSRSKACIFDEVIPHLQYSVYNPKVVEVARHIQCAMDKTCLSWPLKDDKSVPGKFTGNILDPGLHRVLEGAPDGIYAKNSYQKTQACNRGFPYFEKGLPEEKYDKATQQCDEFPFASTKEGAGVGDWNFSVLGVTSRQNSCAGNALGRYYRDDRILSYRPEVPFPGLDKYYVRIIDKVEDGGPEFCSPPDDGTGGPPNLPPVVNAGPDVGGDEGSPISLGGSASDAEDVPDTSWTYSPGPDTDPGAACHFGDQGSLATTITCTDDGTFTVTLTANDGVNGAVSDSATVTVRNVAPTIRPNVPTAQADSAISSPRPWQLFRVGDTVELAADFTDPGANDTHRCSAVWDDGLDEQFDSFGRSCERSHIYTRAGMFTIGSGVVDDDTGAGHAKVMIVDYDPVAGVARGNGWLDAPGRGGFDFTGSYPTRAAVVPDGAVTFALPPENRLNLRSHQRLEWLVVTPDGKIAIKGKAERIPGQDVGFVLYGYYGCPPGVRAGCQPGPHRLRMVVWDVAAHGPIPEGVPAIYDSRSGRPFDVDEADPQNISQGVLQIQHPPMG